MKVGKPVPTRIALLYSLGVCAIGLILFGSMSLVNTDADTGSGFWSQNFYGFFIVKSLEFGGLVLVLIGVVMAIIYSLQNVIMGKKQK